MTGVQTCALPIFLAFEMVEESTLGQARIIADIVYGGGRIAFGTDQVHCSIENTDSRGMDSS